MDTSARLCWDHTLSKVTKASFCLRSRRCLDVNHVGLVSDTCFAGCHREEPCEAHLTLLESLHASMASISIIIDHAQLPPTT